MIRRVYWSFFFWLVLVSSTAFKLTKAGEGPTRRLSTFPEECSYPCTHTTVDLLLKKGQQTCPPAIQEAGDKFVTGGGIHLCRALRGEVGIICSYCLHKEESSLMQYCSFQAIEPCDLSAVVHEGKCGSCVRV
eukprot:10992.XXX_398162_398780_1 [CDS] Oithona nana genome sequencing.